MGFDIFEVTDLEKDPAVSEKQDPNIVDFDGPDDPEKAANWSVKHKYSILTLISAMTFITYACSIHLPSDSQLTESPTRPLASSMFAPGVP